VVEACLAVFGDGVACAEWAAAKNSDSGFDRLFYAFWCAGRQL